MIALLGCAPRGAQAPAPAADLAANPTTTAGPQSVPATSPCLVADTAGAPHDTLFTIAVEPPTDAALDCAGRAIPLASPPAIVTLTIAPGTDLRDVLDRGVQRPDVIVTADPDVLAYAGRTQEWIMAALPWVTTYVVAGIDPAPAIPSPADRDALAHDAVSADARGAAPPFSWLTDSVCARQIATQPGEPRPIIGYPAGDVTARQLAERMAARGTTPRRVAPFAPNALPGLIAARNVELVVFPVIRDPATHCGTRGNEAVLRGATPLVDTRAHVIVRRGSGAAFVVAGDGSLRFLRRVAP